MLTVIKDLRERAKQDRRKIVLPEGEDSRVLEAADYIDREKLADIILLGNKDRIKLLSGAKKLNLNGVEIIEPASSGLLKEFTAKLCEMRKGKGMTEQEAKALLIEKPVFFGAMLVREKMAEGFVGGAVHTTRDVARAALYCIGLNPKIGTMSSSFIMALDDESFGERGVLIFADCGIVPDPSPKQLANIAISASKLMHNIFAVTPRVALLSFSTKGSGESPQTKKVVEALNLVRQAQPDLLADGELQGDAALVPEVAKIKAPDSPIGGKANVLIFPNLEAGNIAYKLTQRLAKARALGPLLHGVLAPCSDLSRGCDKDDIIDIVCVTSIRCAKQPH
jgi:phosphate acetyltransferase